MSKILTETSQWDSNVVVPTDGDARNAASVETPYQSLTNRSLFLKDGIPGLADSSTIWLEGSPESQAISPATQKPTGFLRGIDFNTSGTQWFLGWTQVDAQGTGTHVLQFLVPLRHGTLTGVTAHVIGQGLRTTAWHGGGLPSTMPRLDLYRQLVDGTVTSGTPIASATDSSASTTAYHTKHTIALTGLSESINATSVLIVRLSGELGTNAQDNAFRCFGVEATVEG